MKMALADKPAVPFRVPPGIKLIRVDPKTGMRATGGERTAILEAFKPGTAPPDSYSVIGVTDQQGRPLGVSPEADRMIRSGTGGLYQGVTIAAMGTLVTTAMHDRYAG